MKNLSPTVTLLNIYFPTSGNFLYVCCDCIYWFCDILWNLTRNKRKNLGRDGRAIHELNVKSRVQMILVGTY